jgi:hypothetical protein
MGPRRAALAALTLAAWALPAAGSHGAERPGSEAALAGQVLLAGPAPAVAPVPVGKDRWLCGDARVPAGLRVAPGGGVADALVILEADAPPRRAAPGPVQLDNRGCEFLPRVQVAPVGSDLEVLSSDPVLHTAHAYLDGRETLFHVALPVFRSRRTVHLDRAGLVTIECDAGHAWMRAFLWVTATRLVAVTDAEGRFRLDGAPPGRHRVRVWHEVLGERTIAVEAGPGGRGLVTIQLGR